MLLFFPEVALIPESRCHSKPRYLPPCCCIPIYSDNIHHIQRLSARADLRAFRLYSQRCRTVPRSPLQNEFSGVILVTKGQVHLPALQQLSRRGCFCILSNGYQQSEASGTDLRFWFLLSSAALLHFFSYSHHSAGNTFRNKFPFCGSQVTPLKLPSV